jgi:MFS family permease
MPRGYWPLIGAVLLFGVGDFSRSFLILAVAKAAPVIDDGTTMLFGLPVLLYALHNGVSAVATFPSGHLADRFGRRRVLATGYFLGLGVNLTLAFGSRSLAAVCFAFLLSGVAIAVEETVEKACVAEMLSRGVPVVRSGHVGDRQRRRRHGLIDRGWALVGPDGRGAAFGSAAGFSAAGLIVLVVIARQGDRSAPTAGSSS